MDCYDSMETGENEKNIPQKSTRKQSAISLKLKMQLLREVDMKKSLKTDICRKYGIANSTLSTIVKNRERLTRLYQRSTFGPERKRMRTPKHEFLEAALLAWFDSVWTGNMPISGHMLMEKANEIAVQLNIEFTANPGWLERFKKRNGIISDKCWNEDKTKFTCKLAKLPEDQIHPKDDLLLNLDPIKCEDSEIPGNSNFAEVLFQDGDDFSKDDGFIKKSPSSSTTGTYLHRKTKSKSSKKYKSHSHRHSAASWNNTDECLPNELELRRVQAMEGINKGINRIADTMAMYAAAMVEQMNKK